MMFYKITKLNNCQIYQTVLLKGDNNSFVRIPSYNIFFQGEDKFYRPTALNPIMHGRFYRPISKGVSNDISVLSFEGARPEKGLNIRPYSKISKPKSQFLKILQKLLQK